MQYSIEWDVKDKQGNLVQETGPTLKEWPSEIQGLTEKAKAETQILINAANHPVRRKEKKN